MESREKSTDRRVFFVLRPSVLFESFDILPTVQMTDDERLNALTRLVIIITLLLILFQVQEWYLFFVGGIIIILFLWVLTRREDEEAEYFACHQTPTPSHLFMNMDREMEYNISQPSHMESHIPPSSTKSVKTKKRRINLVPDEEEN